MSLTFPNAIFTEKNVDSFSYSFSFYRDNNNYLNDSGIEIKSHADLINADFSYTINGKYELIMKCIYNKQSNNEFMLSHKGPYIYLNFNYHLKERIKFPLNLSMGLNYGESLKYDYNLNNINLKIYKELNTNFYPMIPFFEYSHNNITYFYEEKEFSESFSSSTVGILFKLNIIDLNNSLLNDIIWTGITLTNVGKNMYAGINIGINHHLN